jgi:hypothetical protein
MNDLFDMWNLPWHALHRGQQRPAKFIAPGTQSGALPTTSWLGRARDGKAIAASLTANRHIGGTNSR